MKKLYVFVLSVIAVLAANAEPVSRSEALQKARQFMPGKQFNANQAFSRSKRVMADKEPFYIFNAEEGGFVVISGDDRTVPVIGYSEKGQLLQDDMPDNLRNWLEGYAEQLQAIENGEATPALPRSAKVTRGVSAKPAIAPLIKTTWNQSGPYSLRTPTYTHKNYNNEDVTEHTVTGCVATALAQVMNYYQWPASCPALEGYITSTLGLNVESLLATTFNWNLMKNSYSDSETGEEALEVSKLMRYIGQAIYMNYNLGENGGSAGSADLDVMINTFGYSKQVYSESRGNYTTAEWEDMLYRELAAGRPVLYDGAANTGASHQFICDGYDGNGLFHINWGWGSYQDNYFVISLANPTDTGIGGGTAKSGYIFRQAAVFGFQPATDGEPEIPRFNSNVDGFTDDTYTRSSAANDFVNVSTSGCKFSASYSYVPTTTYSVEAGWALWKNDQVLSVLEAYTKNNTIDYTKLDVGWFYSYNSPTSVSFGAGLPDGDYRLVQVWRPQGSTGDWTMMSSMKSLRVNISGNTLTICKPQYTPVTYTVNDVDFGGKLATGKVTKVVVNLTNTCDANQEPLYLWVGDGSSWAGKSIASVDPGTTGNAEILYTPTNSGEYSVKITSDESGNDVMWSSTITIYGVVQTTIDGIVYKYVEGDDYADIVGSVASVFENQPLVIPSTVTVDAKTYYIRKIESSAFRLVSMTSLTIEDGVESIETQAFMSCYSLTEVTLPSTLKSIGTYAFYNCYRVESLVIPEGVESIGASAFGYCYWQKNVTLPSTLQSIGEQAFAGINLKNLISSMQHPCTIASNAFSNVDLAAAALYVPEGTKSEYLAAAVWQDFGTMFQGEVKEIEIAGITYRYTTGDDTADIVGANSEYFNLDAQYVNDLLDLVIPGSITISDKTYKVRKIQDDVFNYYSFKTITIEPGLEEIGNGSFFYCFIWGGREKKAAIVIPESVKAIGAEAFRNINGFDGLEISLTLPSTLTSIGDYAFGGKTSGKLTEVNCRAIRNPFAISANVFQAENGSFTSAKLIIPKDNSKVVEGRYQATAGWQQFFGGTNTIEELAGRCDANSDGSVSVTDIAVVVNSILEIENGADFDGFGADANGDGGITVTDIGVIVDMILGTGGTNNARRMTRDAVEPQ